uniref:Secreted protein n=1 Tax=Peronospora matthiolae TaxID=2874970 RepID=A0AAV1TS08_9STRA
MTLSIRFLWCLRFRRLVGNFLMAILVARGFRVRYGSALAVGLWLRRWVALDGKGADGNCVGTMWHENMGAHLNLMGSNVVFGSRT